MVQPPADTPIIKNIECHVVEQQLDQPFAFSPWVYARRTGKSDRTFRTGGASRAGGTRETDWALRAGRTRCTDGTLRADVALRSACRDEARNAKSAEHRFNDAIVLMGHVERFAAPVAKEVINASLGDLSRREEAKPDHARSVAIIGVMF